MEQQQQPEPPPTGTRVRFYLLGGRMPAAYREWTERQMEPVPYVLRSLVRLVLFMGLGIVLFLSDHPGASMRWAWVLVYLPFLAALSLAIQRPLYLRGLRKAWDRELNPPPVRQAPGGEVLEDPPLRGRDFPDRL